MSSDTFQVQRFGEEKQDDLENEQDLLAKLKAKIAGSRPEVKSEKVREEKKEESSEPKTKKNKKKRKRENVPQDSEENTGFTKLGVFDAKDKAKVRRVLPKWLAQPDIVSLDLGDQQMPIEDMKELDESILQILKSTGAKYFFPVQRQVIPQLILSAKRKFFRPSDICVSAPTGSGKTLAFVLPIVQSLKSRIVPRVRALVILPVQDLAAQVFKVFRAYTENNDLRVKLLSGQKSFSQEQNELVMPGIEPGTFHSLADIIVATPGRLVDHLQKTEGFSLTHLQFLIIDEADRVMEDVQNDWLNHVDRAVYSNPETRPKPGPINCASLSNSGSAIYLQKLLFSATLSQNPEKLQQLELYEPKLYTSVVDPEDILANEGLDGNNADEESFVGQYTTPKELTETVLLIEDTLKKPLSLVNLIHQKEMKKVLIFAKSIENSHKLTLMLQAMQVKVSELSSQLKRGKRGKILNQFKNDKIDILVATDALARGIDIGKIDFVISYDCPKFVKTYIHRVGRTARAGQSGRAVTLIENNQLKAFKMMLKQVGKNHQLEEEQIQVTENDVVNYEKALEQAKELT